MGVFWRFLNCTNDTKSRKASHIRITILIFQLYLYIQLQQKFFDYFK